MRPVAHLHGQVGDDLAWVAKQARLECSLHFCNVHYALLGGMLFELSGPVVILALVLSILVPVNVTRPNSRTLDGSPSVKTGQQLYIQVYIRQGSGR